MDGDTALFKLQQPCAILGSGIAGKLEINLLSYKLMKMFYPKRTKKNFANAAEAFNTQYIIPNGVLCTNTNYDENYIFCPISFVRQLMGYEGEVTSMEIQLKEGVNKSKARNEIADIVGDKYIIKNPIVDIIVLMINSLFSFLSFTFEYKNIYAKSALDVVYII